MNVYKEGRMMKEQLISARVSAEVKQRLETAAHEERRSLSNYVALVLEQHVAERLPSGLEKLRNVTRSGTRPFKQNPKNIRQKEKAEAR
jgi:predicted DNA-binding protein